MGEHQGAKNHQDAFALGTATGASAGYWGQQHNTSTVTFECNGAGSEEQLPKDALVLAKPLIPALMPFSPSTTSANTARSNHCLQISRLLFFSVLRICLRSHTGLARVKARARPPPVRHSPAAQTGP